MRQFLCEAGGYSQSAAEHPVCREHQVGPECTTPGRPDGIGEQVSLALAGNAGGHQTGQRVADPHFIEARLGEPRRDLSR